jgi:ABC transport system ATP-binding/permease protein
VEESEQPNALEVTVGANRAVVQPGQAVVIGREAGCDVRVAHSLVSRRHAEITWSGEGWVLRDLGSSNGTYLDGKPVRSVRIGPGTSVRLGGPGEDGALVRLGPVPVPAPARPAAPRPPVEVPTRPVAQPSTPPPVRSGPPPVTSAPPAPRPPVEAQTRPVAPLAGTPTVPTPAPRHEEPTRPVTRGPAAALSAQAPAPSPAQPPGAAQSASPTVAGRALRAEHAVTGRVRIGRGEGNDVVLGDLTVSRRHAEVRPAPGGGAEVVDLGSRNGTFLNGRQVSRAPLHDGDLIAVGRHRFAYAGGRLRESVDTGPVSLVADDLMVRIGDQVLLDDISFALPAASLLAVIGPSGCGKSTLLRAMTGLRPATTGRVRYDGRDLYEDYAELRYRIGMVPQDDVLHRQLTVRRALRFSAALRFADDVPRRQRWSRVDEVLATLGLTSRARQRVDTLSGGQRKRTSVALELLTEPSLLYLDEPTSGLDPALDKEVMTELREIADSGRTVVVVTHSVLHLDLCDRVLVLCQGGTMGYFGPPDQLLDFFGAKDYAEIFAGVTEDPKHWTRTYRGSELYRQYVLDVIDKQEPSPPAEAAAAEPKAAARARRALHPAAPIRQFGTLCMRMLAVISADRGYTLFLLGLPLALALITRTVPGHDGLGPPAEPFSLEAQRLLVVLAVGAAFLGIATAIREIVNEATIYRRERAVGLSPTAYLASKLAVFALIDTVQVILFVYLSLLGRGKPREALVVGSPLAEVMVAVALVALASTALGLLVSALVRTTEQTTPVLVVAVMGQLVLSGGLFELNGQAVLEQVAWLAPTRWGFAAGAGTVDLQSMIRTTDPLWTHAAWSWWRAVALMCVQAAVLAGLARLALRRHEPGR